MIRIDQVSGLGVPSSANTSHWYEKLLSWDGASLALGALLAGIIGLITWKVQQRSTLKSTRYGLGSLLYVELSTDSFKRPIYLDPIRRARYVRYTSIVPLLTAGVINPQSEDDLLVHLVWMNYLMESHNDLARRYNDLTVSIGGSNATQMQMLQQLEREIYGSASDVERARIQALDMVERLAPPVPLINPDLEPDERYLQQHNRAYRLKFRFLQWWHRVRARIKRQPKRVAHNANQDDDAQAD